MALTCEYAASTDPLLAYSWDNRLAVLRAVVDIESGAEQRGSSMMRRRVPRVTFVYVNEWRGPCRLVALQWVTRKMLVVYTNEHEMLVFDRQANQVTERCDLRAVRLISNNRLRLAIHHYRAALPGSSEAEAQQLLLDEVDDEDALELSYYQGVRSHKGSLYLLVSLLD